jgi:hypothetical protein
VDTTGWFNPVGHIDKYPSVPCGTTVIFNEYAAAVDGIRQADCRIGKSRGCKAANEGPPNGPFDARVSATRQGGSA